MITQIFDNFTRCRCACGKEFDFVIQSWGYDYPGLRETVNDAICQDCQNAAELAKKTAYNERLKREIEETYLERTKKTGIPQKFLGFEEPPVRPVAEWIWHNRDRNLLLSGETGAGKTTGAVFVARQMLKKQLLNVKYVELIDLLAAWRVAKTSDRGEASVKFLSALERLDILIVDELVNKAKVTASGAELIFDIINAAYNGKRGAKIWLIGNFYDGSIADIFEDPMPIYRRLRESFLCAKVEKNKVIELKF